MSTETPRKPDHETPDQPGENTPILPTQREPHPVSGETPVVAERPATPKKRKGLLVGLGAGAAGVAVLGGAFFGLKDKFNTPPASAEVSAPATPGVESPSAETDTEPALSGAEKQYNKYLASLTPEQLAVVDSLTSEKLQAMTDAEYTQAFSIDAPEVTGADGQIDPQKLAVAFTTRIGAMYMAGTSEADRDELAQMYGSLEAVGSDKMAVYAGDLQKRAIEALRGTAIQDIEPSSFGIVRAGIVSSVEKLDKVDLPDYKVLTSINGEVTVNADGSVSFSTETRDTWSPDMEQITGDGKAIYLTDHYKIGEVTISPDGQVVIGSIQ